MSRFLIISFFAFVAVAAVLSSATKMADRPPKLSTTGTLPNITVRYECTNHTDCTGCVHNEIPQNECISPADDLWVMYSCVDGGNQVELKVFGTIKELCSKHNPLHVTKKYPTNVCNAFPAKLKGYTWYTCPQN